MTDSNNITIYTDGSCLNNPGHGGWAAILLWQGHEKIIAGFEADTTNNRMELTAVIQALKALKSTSHTVDVYTDSTYVQQGITTWLPNWKANNFKSKQRKDIKNKDLWIELDYINQQYYVNYMWVKAHSDNAYNNRVDALAREQAIISASS